MTGNSTRSSSAVAPSVQVREKIDDCSYPYEYAHRARKKMVAAVNLQCRRELELQPTFRSPSTVDERRKATSSSRLSGPGLASMDRSVRHSVVGVVLPLPAFDMSRFTRRRRAWRGRSRKVVKKHRRLERWEKQPVARWSGVVIKVEIIPA